MEEENLKEEMISTFLSTPMLAHRVLFPHRHKDPEAACHEEIVVLFHSDKKRVGIEAFRGCGKSTYVEETAILKALYGKKKYIMIVGPSWSSACERLFSIKTELENNQELIEIYGDQVSEPWAADNIVLANGCKIQAVGAGQALRGKKHGTERPDCIIIDDLEDEDNTDTDMARMKVRRWFNKVLVPMLHPTEGQILFIGTPVNPKALIESKRNDPQWTFKVYPITYIDISGEEKSMWPERFPMDWISDTRNSYMNDGDLTSFNQEYMCRAEDEASKPFQQNMIKVAPVAMNYMPVYIICDPARTVNEKKSARTGYVAASWISNRLVVHAAKGSFHRPDEIINTLFDWNDRFHPVYVGVETNALEEFIMQPLRAKMLDKKISLPLLDLRAPKDKLGFIKGLQPFYMSGSVVHVEHLPDLENELLGFPTGRIDVINALAYMLKVRAGRPVYEDFSADHVTVALDNFSQFPRYLVISSRPAMTAASVVQVFNDELRVLKSWVMNMPPLEAFPDLLRQVVAEFGEVKVGAPIEQFDTFLNNGLPAAARQQHVNLQRWSSTRQSEGSLRPWMTKQRQGQPALLVSNNAHWAVNAMGGGYARSLDKHGNLSDNPIDNQYKVVMEGIEAFVHFIDRLGRREDEDENRNYSYTSNGTKYLTTMPRRS